MDKDKKPDRFSFDCGRNLIPEKEDGNLTHHGDWIFNETVVRFASKLGIITGPQKLEFNLSKISVEFFMDQAPGLHCILNFKVDLNLRFSLKNDKSVLQSFS